MMNQADVDQLLGVPGDSGSLGDIRTANCNAVFVEVRRAADVCYNSGMGEPYFSGLTPAGFNSLQAIINAAHDTTGGKKRIEVHCWMVVFRTSGGTVYNAHHSTPTGSLTNLDNYWPTRTDAGAEETNKAFDPGHPLCEDYLTKVYMDIANNYDIDGIHYDYVRFTAPNLGYNPTSLARFHVANPSIANPPASTEPTFQQWRRDQITNLVRKIYSKMQIVKPSVKVSGSFVCGAPGPSSPDRSGFTGTTNLQAYTQYYQDWDWWVRQGFVDMAVPMTYFDYGGNYQGDWTKWINYEKDNHTTSNGIARQMIIGPGLYLNSSGNAITELQQTRTASPNGHYADGFSGYEYQEPYAGATWSSWAPTFASITPTWADVPVQSWKASPTKGFLQGTVLNGPAWVDGAHITTTAGGDQIADGTGFYGFVGVTPGTYTVTCDATAQGLGTQTKSVTIVAGQVSVANFTWGSPTGMSGYVRTSGGVAVSGARIVGPNGGYVSTSAADGSYTLPGMAAGVYAFTVSKNSYATQTQSGINISAGVMANVNFTLNPAPGSGGTISGVVSDSQGHGVGGATVATSSGGYTATTNSDGTYAFTGVTAGTYSVTASMANYSSQTVSNVGVTDGGTADVDFTINPNPPVISSIVASNITTNSATISWTTNVPATSRIDYGQTRSRGTLTAVDVSLVTSHSMTLTGLTQNHIYHYAVISANSLNQSATSTDCTFFTTAPAGGGATVIVDNSDPGWTITQDQSPSIWQSGTSSTDKYGTNYNFSSTVTGSATAACAWTPTIPFTGTYNVYVWFPQGGNRANNAPFTINYSGGSLAVSVDQSSTANNGGKWNQIGTSLQFAAGTSGNVSLTNKAQASKVVLADAVKFESTSPADTTPPTVPTGLSASAISTTQIQLTWTASTDPSGVAGYKIYRNAQLIDSVDSGTTYTDFGLTPNTGYYFSVSAYDIFGNTSTACPVLARATLPLALSVTCDKPASTWQTASNVFTFTNSVGFGGQTIDHVRYVWDQLPSHTWANGETGWTTGTNPCIADPGGNNWYFHARPYNSDNVANGQIDLGPFYCDLTPPTTPVVNEPRYTTATDQLAGSWTSSDPESTVVEYQYAIGTTAGGVDVKNWTSTGSTASATATGLSLTLDHPYYFSVKSRNGAGSGAWSSTGMNTIGTTPARAYASIMDAKGLDNGKAIVLTGRYVTYGASDGTFIQDTDKPSALYLPGVTGFSVGSYMNVGGLLGTNGLLRVLTASEPATGTGTVTVNPLGMACRSLGGVDINQWTPGLPGGQGANNMGVLVRVAGKVTSSAATYFMLSDGLNEIQVQSTANPGSGNVTVTGICSSTVYNSQIIPMIITRSVLDVRAQ